MLQVVIIHYGINVPCIDIDGNNIGYGIGVLASEFTTGTINPVYVDFIDANGNAFSVFYNLEIICFTKNTEILVEEEDKKTKKKRQIKKKIQDITYDDDLVVWDFDNGCFTTAKPIWIKKPEETCAYNVLKFSDGSELRTIRSHRVFNKDEGKFTYLMSENTPLGTTAFNSEGKDVKLISREVIEETVEYYNIITEYHMNLFANGILTSCRLNNLYPIENMKFVKDDRKLLSEEDLKGIDEKYIKGLRLQEQVQDINRDGATKVGNSLRDYVRRLIETAKPR